MKIRPWLTLCALSIVAYPLCGADHPSIFRAGAVATDISPKTFPRIIAGMFTERTSDKLSDPIYSRAIVLDDGKMKIAFAIVDQCMMEQKLIDEAKALASKQCGIPVDRMMVSATHTHSAPAAMGCLGTRQDSEFAKFLIPKIAESIVEADKRLQPARIGWSSVDDWEHTHNRRWIRLAGKEVVDPFGNPTGRANMHPGYLSKDVVGPSGPVDPQLSVVSIQTKDGKPLAVLANYSQHYFGSTPVSADYFGAFDSIIAKRLNASPDFVCAMSQGTSGDLMWMDYGAEKKDLNLQSYSEAVADYAMKALAQVKYQDHAELGMIEKQVTLKYRTPDKERLTWAQRINAQIQNDLPKDKTEVYAREAVILDQRKETTVKLQAIRIGDLSIATLPNEVYAITGLKLKAAYLRPHFNVELANGAEGYIPPPEQHALGGYTTWPARTAGLEVEAEPKMVAALIEGLGQLGGNAFDPPNVRAFSGVYPAAIIESKAVAAWSLNEASSTMGFHNDAQDSKGALRLVGSSAVFLPGPGSGLGYDKESTLHSSAFAREGVINRAVQLSGGHLETTDLKLGDKASIALWFWLGHESGASDRSGHLIDALGATLVAHQFADHTVKLEWAKERDLPSPAKTPDLASPAPCFADDWHFAVLIRDGEQLRVHLDGSEQPILTGKAGENTKQLIFGQGLQSRLDEITVWDRAIEPKLIAQLWKTSKVEDDNARHAVERAERAKRLAVQKDTQLKQHENWSVSMRFRNTKPNNVSAVTAYLVSRGPKGDHQAPGDHLGIGGNYKDSEPGKIFVFNGNAADNIVRGKTIIEPGTWNDVKLERAGSHVKVTLNGKVEIDTELPVTAAGAKELFFGRRCDDFGPLQGEYENIVVAGLETPKSATPSPKPTMESQPRSPEESLKAAHVPEGYEIELVAAEPLVLDPVAFDWDERGRLWVVEMADYPLGMDGNGKPGGRVRVLEDTDGDGRYDKSSIFAEGLNFPNGILCWRGGCIVSAAPDILYLQDTKGSGKSDAPKKLYSGFLEGNQQLRVNSLRWGLDGWVYCANGGHHVNYGKDIAISSSLTGEKIALGSRDFRFKPDTGEFDPLSGPSQFGRNRDVWSHWFGVQNSYPIWHYVLEDRYLRRNPYIAPPNPRNVMTGSNPPVYPLSGEQKRYHSFNQAGHFTSACAGTPYLDTLLFGDGDITHSFTCEPVHDVVQHFILEDDGVTYKAHRAESESQPDFFASEDRWCRPVMTRTGPDGALWIADMYRYMIEHPAWLPQNGKDDFQPFYREGDDKGRIYRIFPKGKRPAPMKSLDKMNAEELVAVLESSNGWLRDRAQILLHTRADKAAVSALERLIATSKQPLARAHALSALEDLRALKTDTLIAALKDESIGVREHALRIAELHQDDNVVAAAAKLADDPSTKVRLQLALSLGEWKQSVAGEALAKLAQRDDLDDYTRGAILSSALPHLTMLARKIGEQGGRALDQFVEPLLQTAEAGKQHEASTALLLSAIPAVKPGNEADCVQRLHSVQSILQRTNSSVELAAKRDNNPDSSALIERAAAIEGIAKQWLADDAKPLRARIACAALLALDTKHRDEAVTRMTSWLTPSTEVDLQRELVQEIAATGTKDAPVSLLKNWASLEPDTRLVVLDSLMNRESWALDLMERAKAGDVNASSFDAQRQARLLKHPSAKVRKLAEQVFASTANSPRAKVLEAFKPALALKGDAAKGKVVFGTVCIACHQLEGVGRALGPDLRSVVAHEPERLMLSILDPSVDIQPGFTAYFCELKNGEQIYGIIASESGGSITLKLADTSTRTVLRSDIVKLQSSKASLMPDGLEALLTPQSLADLIAYLKTPK